MNKEYPKCLRIATEGKYLGAKYQGSSVLTSGVHLCLYLYMDPFR